MKSCVCSGIFAPSGLWTKLSCVPWVNRAILSPGHYRGIFEGRKTPADEPDLPAVILQGHDSISGRCRDELSALLPPRRGFLLPAGLGGPGTPDKALLYFVFLEIGVLSKADRLILPYQGSCATVNGFL